MAQFQTQRTDFSTTRIVEAPERTELAAGEIVASVERFAFTANNISYATAGDTLGYWQFFPSVGEQTEAWGVIPVWGFAEITASNVEGLPIGERLFGYFPPAKDLTMTPSKVFAERFMDSAAHRTSLPRGYNLYSRVSAEPGYDSSLDNHRMLLWPLFITSFCLGDVLKLNGWYGAKQIVIISASSKTSIGLAYALDEDQDAPSVVGLTSRRNKLFVESLGLYDSTFTYDELNAIDASLPTVIVDMSGNSDVLGALHRRLCDNLHFCINVGYTHWDAANGNKDIIQERSEFFFAPSHIQRRVAEWGAASFDKKTSKFLTETVSKSREWLKFDTRSGLQGLENVYPDICAGQIPPDTAIIIEI